VATKLGGLAGDTLIYGLGNGFHRLAQLLTLPIFTSYLAPDEFGTIALLTVFGLVCRAIFGLGFGISTGIVYFRVAEANARSAIAKTSFVIAVFASVLLVAIVLAVAPTLSWLVLGSAEMLGVLILFAISAALQNAVQPTLLRLQFLKQPIRYVILSTGSAFISVAVALWLVAVEGRGVWGWVEGAVVGGVVGLILGVVFNRDAIGAAIDWKSARELLRLGLPVVPSFGFMFVVQNSGTYMLQHQASMDQVGIYSVGLNMGLALGVVVAAFITAWTPFFQSYATNQKSAPPVFRRVATYYAIAAGLLACLFFVFAKPAVALLTEARFHDAYRVVGIAAFSQFLLGVWSVLLPGIYFAGKTYLQTVVQGTAAALVVVLNIVLIPRLGIEGAALAMALGMLAMNLLLALVNRMRRFDAMAFSLGPMALIGLAILPAAAIQRIADEVLSMVPATATGLTIAAVYAVVGFRLVDGESRSRLVEIVNGVLRRA